MPDETSELCCFNQFASSMKGLRIALSILLRADKVAQRADVRYLNPVALDLLTHHVTQLSELSAEQYAEAVLSGELKGVVADVASATQALTVPGGRQLQ